MKRSIVEDAIRNGAPIKFVYNGKLRFVIPTRIRGRNLHGVEIPQWAIGRPNQQAGSPKSYKLAKIQAITIA